MVFIENAGPTTHLYFVGPKGEKGEIGATGFQGATGATGNQVYISINIKITIFKRFIKKQCVQI